MNVDPLPLIDSHCHLSAKENLNEIQDILARAEAVGVRKFVNICTDLSEMPALLETSNMFRNVYCTVGTHPHEASKELLRYDQKFLAETVASYCANPVVIGIGEIGLDYYYNHSPHTDQQSCFEHYLEIAAKLQMPVSIHTREAEEDTVKILTKYAPHLTGVIHCFTGSAWLAQEVIKLGFYISISGVITFKKSLELREIVRTIPLERLLIETDAPFLAPLPHRGKRNEPSYIIETSRTLAEVKGVSDEEIALETTQNFFRLFPKAK